MIEKKLKKYFFILGKNPEVSLAELCAVLKKGAIDWEPIFASQDALCIETKQSLDSRVFMNTVGGVRKMGEIQEIATVDSYEERLADHVPKTDRKCYAGVSIYAADDVLGNKEMTRLQKQAEKILLGLKSEGRAMRVVTSKEPQLSSVIVQKNKLLSDRGVEIVLFYSQDQICIGTTSAVQPFWSYGERDFERPGRDARSGMLPPKLAQILINLSGAQNNEVVWDPFCGSGTILQEALLLGFTNLIGSDSSERAISDTQINLEWLEKKHQTADTNVLLFMLPAEEAENRVREKDITAIVTEPYLGQPLAGRETLEKLENIRSELTTLYRKSFRVFDKVLPYGGTVSFVFPVWRIHSGHILIDVPSVIKNTALVPQKLLDISLTPFGFENNAQRQSVLYGREGQRVLREILVFKKEKEYEK